MPIRIASTAAPAGTTYVDIRMGGSHSIHQIKYDVSTLTGAVDANGSLPVGLPIKLSAGVAVPVSSTTDVIAGFVGPETVHIGTDPTDIFGNIMRTGDFNRDAIEANLGRALNANELASIALVGAIRLQA